MLLGFMSVSACSIWPNHGSGGMAEHLQKKPSSLFTQAQLNSLHDLPAALKVLERQLDYLLLNGVQYCFPASASRARVRANRITREIHGGLQLDALNNLITQREALDRLSRRFNTAKQKQLCVLPPPPESSLQFNHSPSSINTKFKSSLHPLIAQQAGKE